AGAVPLNESVAGLNVSQPGSAWPFCSLAVKLSAWPCGSLNVPAGSASEMAVPAFQLWVGVGVCTTGAPMMVAEKLSDTDSPLVSVAVTTRPSVCAVAGAVPLNESVVGLNVSQP